MEKDRKKKKKHTHVIEHILKCAQKDSTDRQEGRERGGLEVGRRDILIYRWGGG